jgi:hypothetical protein
MGDVALKDWLFQRLEEAIEIGMLQRRDCPQMRSIIS